MFQSDIWNFFKSFCIALKKSFCMRASEEGHAEIVKILVKQEGIDINAQDI